ncbi:hypothetical protein [Asaia krungthepensis]|uniref:Uncharacterized protein n=1 Tax=Asaia krungthepensis NRIC 0535 TaxID=1307925 RepID=A0ABQ0Q107_9PROT|nr:hypothetical protein [Asaia krungthepensis]GBQ86506.1 hypothetical protein AA0535_1038 [Asaia krungthepensis NRIC 0535]
MTETTTSPAVENRILDQGIKTATTPVRDTKSVDHGDFKVHVQLLGSEWSRKH